MGARWYSPATGTFLSADSIVPEPGNPQDLNRFAYVRGNPLRYTDPTGHYSEEQIQAYFGVESWDQVLQLFGDGGALHGKWGWLETLRQAQNGDGLTFIYGSGSFTGKGVFGNGHLSLQSGIGLDTWLGGTIDATVVGILGEHFSLTRQDPIVYDRQHLVFSTDATAIYRDWRLHLNKVDWTGAKLDATGIVLDLFTVGFANRATSATKLTKFLSQGDTAFSGIRGGMAVAKDQITGDTYSRAWDGAGTTIAGLAFFSPAPIPVLPSVLGLMVDFGRAIDYSP